MIYGHKRARISFSCARSARFLMKVKQLEKILFLFSHLLQASQPNGEFKSISEGKIPIFKI